MGFVRWAGRGIQRVRLPGKPSLARQEHSCREPLIVVVPLNCQAVFWLIDLRSRDKKELGIPDAGDSLSSFGSLGQGEATKRLPA